MNLWRGGGDSGCCQGKYVLSCDYGNIATHSLGKIIQIDYCGFKPGFYSKFELLYPTALHKTLNIVNTAAMPCK